MSRLVKFIAYLALFVVSFLLFLYWMFPYSALRDRVLGAIEQQLGSGVSVTAETLEPYWFSGVEVSGLEVEGMNEGRAVTLLKCRRLRARAGLVSLLVGSPRISFLVEIGKGEISGTARRTEEELDLDLELDNVDLGTIQLIQERTGLKLSSRIGGVVRLMIDRQRPLRSTGKIDLDLRDIVLKPSMVKLGEMEMEMPELALSKGRESRIRLEVDRGAIAVESIVLKGGDLGIDLKGKVFLSTRVDNYRFNVSGSFSASEKLGQALPFLFIIEKQKREDGSYPISITGRLARPSIKIGTFTVPL